MPPRKTKTPITSVHKAPPPRGGRPPSPFPLRLPVRHTAEMLESWRRAAATCGLSVQDWIRTTLGCEVESAIHVRPLRREVSRG